MKFLVAVLLLVSAQAFACPDITGSFSCKYKNRLSEREITKTADGFLINIDGIELEYVTDGSITTVPQTDSLKDGQYSSVCDANTFVINFSGTMMEGDLELGHQVQKTVYQMKGDALNINIKTKAKRVPLPTIDYTCTRH